MPPRRGKPLDLASAFDVFGQKLIDSASTPNINRYTPMPHQDLFHKAQTRHRVVTGGNQCLAEGTLVRMADGRVRAIEDIRVGDEVIAIDGTATRVIATWDQGVKLVHDYAIGRFGDLEVITCTPDHKFWGALDPTKRRGPEFAARPIGTLVDNKRARHKVMRSQGTRFGGAQQNGRAFTLGLLLGNGHLPAKLRSQPSQIQFTTSDTLLIEEMHGLFQPSGNSGIQYTLHPSERSEFAAWLDDLGLAGCRSRAKFIPAEVWGWDETSIAQLVAGMLVTDGSWWEAANRREAHCSYSSRSLQLVEQLRTLMGIRLGIWGSTVTSVDRVGSSHADGIDYQITFGTREALELIARLPLRGRKRALALTAAATPQRNSKASLVGVRQLTEAPRPVRCHDITVDHPEHIFMLANGLLTSNSGKTYSTSADDVLTQLRRHPHRQHLYAERPLRGRVITVDFDRGIEQVVLPYWQQMVPPSALINGSWTDSYSPGQHLLTLADGGQVSFMSYEQDPDKFQGVWLDWVHFDEEPPKPIWSESMVRLLRTGGCWTLSMTPVQQMEWVQDDVLDPAREGLLPDVSVWDLDTRKNIYLSQTQIAELESTLTEDEKKVRFEGQHLNHSMVFGEFTRKYPNVIPEQPFARFRPSWGWQVFEHMDHGYANPTSWIWTAVHEDGSIVTFQMLYQDHVIVQEWARRVHEMRDRIRDAFDDPDWMPAATFGDPAIGQQNNGITGLTVQQEYARHGVGIATDGIVKARTANQMFGLNRMHTYLAPRPIAAGPAASNGELGMPWWQITDNCQHLIAEMRKARKPKQTLKQQEVKNTSEEIRDKDNHAIDAAKYLFMSVPDLRPVRFQTVEGEVPDWAYQTLRPAPAAIATHDQAYATISSDRRGSRSDDYDALEGA